MKRMGRWGIAAAAALVVGTTMVAAPTANAGNGHYGLNVEVNVYGPDALSVLNGLTVEVYTDPGGVLVDPLDCNTLPDQNGPFSAWENLDCGLSPGDYVIGLDGVPAGWDIGGSCQSGSQAPNEPLDLGGNEAFSFFGGSEALCTLYVSASTLLVDKVVVGGPASSADFTIEVTDGDGGPVVASGSDVADATCEADFDTAKCGVIVVPSGTGYFIAEPTVADYELTSVECEEYVDAAEPPEVAAVVTPIGDDGFDHDDGDTYCVVTNTYVPPATTTTTTTTTTTVASTTTESPTTTIAATTTSIDAGVVTLPETGASQTANTWMSVIALALLASGGALLLARRRTS